MSEFMFFVFNAKYCNILIIFQKNVFTLQKAIKDYTQRMYQYNNILESLKRFIVMIIHHQFIKFNNTFTYR